MVSAATPPSSSSRMETRLRPESTQVGWPPWEIAEAGRGACSETRGEPGLGPSSRSGSSSGTLILEEPPKETSVLGAGRQGRGSWTRQGSVGVHCACAECRGTAVRAARESTPSSARLGRCLLARAARTGWACDEGRLSPREPVPWPSCWPGCCLLSPLFTSGAGSAWFSYPAPS